MAPGQSITGIALPRKRQPLSRYPRADARGTLEEVMLIFSGIHPWAYAHGPLRMFG
jgi:hypothetical protein